MALLCLFAQGAWADFTPNAEKGYKLKLKGYDLYVNFSISGYTETNAVNATKLTNEDGASVFAISSVAETENGFNLKWRNEYMKKAGTWSWNSGHGTTADTWYIVPVEIDGETYYNIKKNTNASGDIFFGTNQTVGEGTYLYTNVNGGDINWELVECTYDAMMVNQGYWPETSTDAAPKYYGIKNLRASKFAQFATNNSMMALVNQNNFDASCYFYFIDVEEDELPYDVKAVKIKNAAAPGFLCANANSYNTTGATWYLKKGVYTSNTESIAIGKSSTDWSSNGWNNYQGTGNFISTWSSNDQGSAWEIVELNDQPHAIVPTISTADNKVLYSIFNFRVNKFADSQEEGQQIKEVETRGLGSFWYFEDASAENTVELNAGVLPVYMVNALNGKYLKSHSTGTNSGSAQYVDNKADAQIWYLSPHHKANGNYHYYGYGIGKTTEIAGGYNGQVAWNDNGGNYVCQYGVDDAGSIWKFVSTTDADVNTVINNAKTAWNKEVALCTFADYYSYDKNNVTAFVTAVEAVTTSGNNISKLQSAYLALTARKAMLAGEKTGVPAAGDVIRLKNLSNGKYMNQADAANTLSVVDAESDNNLWILGGDAENGFSLQNKASQKYLKGAGQSTNFSLSDDPVMFDITNIENCFVVLRQHDMNGNYAYAHFGAGTNTIVGWETGADATRWAIGVIPPLPSGYYYIKNKASNKYLVNNYDFTTTTTLSGSKVTTNNGVWKVDVNDNKTITLKNGIATPLYVGGTSISKLTFEGTALALGVYFTEGIDGSGDALAIGSEEAAATTWVFEPITSTDKIVDVIINGDNGEGVVTYNNNQKAINGGFFRLDESTMMNADHFTANEIVGTECSYIKHLNAKPYYIDVEYYVYNDAAVRKLQTLIDEIVPNVQNNEIGYPKFSNGEVSPAYADIWWYYNDKTLLTSGDSEEKQNKYTSALQSARTIANCSDINLPTAGGFYTLTNADGTVTKTYYIKEGNDGLSQLICYENGQFAKISNDFTSVDFSAIGTASGEDFAFMAARTNEKGMPVNLGKVCVWQSGEGPLPSGDGNIYSGWTIRKLNDLTVNLPASSYTTFYAPVAMQVSENLKVYTASVNEGNASVTFHELPDGKIPARTGVLIAGNKEDFNAKSITVLSESVDEQESDLKGAEYTQSYALGDNTGYNSTLNGESIGWHAYTLQSGTWKRYTGTQLSGFKAHLELEDIEANNATKAYTFSFGENIVTSIDELFGNAQTKQVFDLSGRQVNKTQRGLYIVNGNKVLR